MKFSQHEFFLSKLGLEELFYFWRKIPNEDLAIVFFYLDSGLAEEFLSLLDTKSYTEILTAIPNCNKTPERIENVAKAISDEIHNPKPETWMAWRLIKFSPEFSEKTTKIIEKSDKEFHQNLSAEIKRITEKMDPLNLLLRLPSFFVQRLFVRISNTEIAPALATTTDEVKNFVFSNISKFRGEELKGLIETISQGFDSKVPHVFFSEEFQWRSKLKIIRLINEIEKEI